MAGNVDIQSLNALTPNISNTVRLPHLQLRTQVSNNGVGVRYEKRYSMLRSTLAPQLLSLKGLDLRALMTPSTSRGKRPVSGDDVA